jgi:hypothetical protein
MLSLLNGPRPGKARKFIKIPEKFIKKERKKKGHVKIVLLYKHEKNEKLKMKERKMMCEKRQAVHVRA